MRDRHQQRFGPTAVRRVSKLLRPMVRGSTDKAVRNETCDTWDFVRMGKPELHVAIIDIL